MWRLFHYLFGWDYIYWHNTCDHGIARVYKAPDGSAYYVRYTTIQLVDRIDKASQVFWMTCEPSKYMGIIK